MLSSPHLALVSTTGQPHLFHCIERAPLLPPPNGSINCLHADTVDFDPDGPHGCGRSVVPEIDVSLLDIAQVGNLVFVRLGTELHVCSLDEHGVLAATTMPDSLLAAIAASLQGRRAA